MFEEGRDRFRKSVEEDQVTIRGWLGSEKGRVALVVGLVAMVAGSIVFLVWG